MQMYRYPDFKITQLYRCVIVCRGWRGGGGGGGNRCHRGGILYEWGGGEGGGGGGRPPPPPPPPQAYAGSGADYRLRQVSGEANFFAYLTQRLSVAV